MGLGELSRQIEKGDVRLPGPRRPAIRLAARPRTERQGSQHRPLNGAMVSVDRLLHHCHIVNIRGNSYRMREHQDLVRSGSEEASEGAPA